MKASAYGARHGSHSPKRRGIYLFVPCWVAHAGQSGGQEVGTGAFGPNSVFVAPLE
jgi:hypothetical protein